MRVFLDSSAYTKRFVEEPGSQEIENICIGASELGLSIICYPEIISALNRRLREKALNKHDYKIVKNRLAKEMMDLEIINITSAVIGLTTTLLEKNVLRAMDAIHIACAIEWGTELFVTSDQKQGNAARKAKLKTRISI